MQPSWTLEEFTRALDQRLDGLMQGRIRLTDLPLTIQAWYHVGDLYAREALRPEIEKLQAENARLHRENDMLYARAFLSPGERRERILQRLDAGLTEATAERWDQLDQDLAIIAGHTQLNSFARASPGVEAGTNPAVEKGRSNDLNPQQDRAAA